MNKPTINILYLENTPIFEQLQIEEALLRVNDENWCVLNSGSPLSIVMGISGKPELLLHGEKICEDRVPVIRRFSGGGTVVVDGETLFISYLMNEKTLGVPCFPDQVHCWAKHLYQNIFHEHQLFRLRENDYVFGDHKFGGNAQYLRKGRWLHHTTFLWDYEQKHMEYLKIPDKAPKYRLGRPHDQFLCKLKQWLPSKNTLFERVKKELSLHFDFRMVDRGAVLPFVSQPHRKATQMVELPLVQS